MRERLGLFRLAGCGYAVPLERMLRVVDHYRLEQLPLCPEPMAGMLILDSEIVPLLGTSWLLTTASGSIGDATFAVLIATEYGTLALPADATVGIVAVGRGGWAEGEDQVDYFQAKSFSYRGSQYPVLNVDQFVMSLIRS